MTMLDEQQVLDRLDQAKRVLLLEPRYKRKYPPLGLMKIAGYLNDRGTPFEFARAYNGEDCDLAMMTSLFTYDYGPTVDAVRRVKHLDPKLPLVMGGVCATLLRKRWEALDVDVFAGYSKTLDQQLSDYETDWGVEEPWDEFAYTFTARGCPNRCKYCAVSRLEVESWVNPGWRDHVFGHAKSKVMIYDNNISAMPRDHAVELLGELGASSLQVVLDNGVDCKWVDDELAALLAKIRFIHSGLRIAFDRIAEDGVFQQAVRLLLAAGVPRSQITSYILFNFLDTPREADYRARECVKLGVRPYPQQFMPLNIRSRNPPYIGKHWTRQLLKSFRFFWLMAGFYTKQDFEGWALSQEPGSNHALGEADLVKWNDDSKFKELAHG